MTDVNYCLSKTLVSDYGPGVVLVLEDLTGVSSGRGGKGKLSGQLSSWAFYQLGEFVKYKAKRAGITVIEVSPDYTNQRCPMCMTVRKENRDQKSHTYKCSSYGYQTNDDRVAAMNLCELGVEYITGDPKLSLESISNEHARYGPAQSTVGRGTPSQAHQSENYQEWEVFLRRGS